MSFPQQQQQQMSSALPPAFPDLQKTLSILDVEMNRATRSYPQQTDESFGRSIQMYVSSGSIEFTPQNMCCLVLFSRYYLLTNQKPKWTEFDICQSDKSGSGNYSAGPYVVKGPSKQVIKDYVISMFLNERVKLKSEKPLCEKLWRNMMGGYHQYNTIIIHTHTHIFGFV